MQGSDLREWEPPTGTLGELTRASQRRAELVAASEPALRAEAKALAPPPSFFAALTQPTVSIIAEVKRSSPSKGSIAPGLDAVEQARAYHAGGAAAISVLTEPDRFGGSLDDLKAVAAAVKLPLLRKDFIVHPVQLWEARVHGAAAALLIVRALSPDDLRLLAAVAREAGLDALFEVRNSAELARALDAGARIVGVNNRNLETLVIDMKTAPSVIPLIPQHIAAIAESGMATPSDALPAIAAGADALLIGSALSASTSPLEGVSRFAGMATLPRGVRAESSSAHT